MTSSLNTDDHFSTSVLLRVTIFAAFIMIGCTSGTEELPQIGGVETMSANCAQNPICQGSLAITCLGQPNQSDQDCGIFGQFCYSGYGCATCEPNLPYCDGDTLTQCTPNGALGALIETCPQGCNNGRCVNACQEAADASSYQGCEYWPSPIGNDVDSVFSFAVVVANPQDRAVNLQVKHQNAEIVTRVIPPNGLEIVELPWVDALKSEPIVDNMVVGFQSSKVRHGAYQLTTDYPVTVYQFSPLEYNVSDDCRDEYSPSDGPGTGCFSYTNDASLLLPVHAMKTQYIVLSYGSTLTINDNVGLLYPSSFQVIGVNPNPTEVTIQFKGYTEASVSGDLRAYSPGEEGTFTLAQGEVLQVVARKLDRCIGELIPEPRAMNLQYCDLDAQDDLSGSFINSNQPVEVFGSHICAFVPFRYFACDHLEESLFPLETWGRSAVVGVTRALRAEPNIIRVFSGADDNRLTFTPNVQESVTLNRGEWVEFETSQSFRVLGTKSLQVAQFLVGQNYGDQDSEQEGVGDPSMSLVPPEDQFRKDYTFLAPNTYSEHWANIIARQGQSVTLNGSEVQGFTLIEGTSWRIAQVQINAGIQKANSAQPFGVWVYGFGAYTSYMYPAGLDLRVINDLMY